MKLTIVDALKAERKLADIFSNIDSFSLCSKELRELANISRKNLRKSNNFPQATIKTGGNHG